MKNPHAQALGRMGGQARSKAKTKAASANARKNTGPRLSKRVKLLLEALGFYADRRRWKGDNQEPIEGDAFGPKGFPYYWSANRDHGQIAITAIEAALKPRKRKGTK